VARHRDAAGECQSLVFRNGYQLFGAMGYTWENDLQFALKRAKAVGIPLKGVKRFKRVYKRAFLGAKLLETAAKLLNSGYDVEVFEAHHRNKVDAPSGTALAMGEAVAQAWGVPLNDVADWARHGHTGARETGHIGFSVLRGGGIVGEHSVTFAGEEEILTLSHSARDRGLFARGALAAAVWVRGRAPGLYDMQDVLGLK